MRREQRASTSRATSPTRATCLDMILRAFPIARAHPATATFLPPIGLYGYLPFSWYLPLSLHPSGFMGACQHCKIIRSPPPHVHPPFGAPSLLLLSAFDPYPSCPVGFALASLSAYTFSSLQNIHYISTWLLVHTYMHACTPEYYETVTIPPTALVALIVIFC